MQYLKLQQKFTTESGTILPELEFVYHTYGKLNTEKSNVIWINHALTANSDAADWWSGLVGEEKLFSPKEFFIVCSNNLGSCYGATNPRSINPETGQKYGKDFPIITIRDQARAQDLLRQHLKIDKIHLMIGGSMGGQISLEWAVEKPKLFKHICLLATNAQHSPWGIAFNTAQRMALETDPTLYDDTPEAGHKGLEAARAIAMLSYRCYTTYDITQKEENHNKYKNFRAESYQKYQGKKLSQRFDPLAYICLSRAMDSHNLARDRGSMEAVLKTIQAKTLIIGIESDILFPPAEQIYLAEYIRDCELNIIKSDYGHDGFLTEFERISVCIGTFLAGKDLTPLKEQLPALPGSEGF